MPDENFLKLHRFNGTETFTVGEGTFRILQHETRGTGILFGIAETSPVETLEDTADLCAEPEATATVYVGDLDESLLAGAEFSIPHSFDDSVGDHVTWFYYVSHEDINNNKIEILAHEGNRVRFRWRGTMSDPVASSNPEAKLEIECWAEITREESD